MSVEPNDTSATGSVLIADDEERITAFIEKRAPEWKGR